MVGHAGEEVTHFLDISTCSSLRYPILEYILLKGTSQRPLNIDDFQVLPRNRYFITSYVTDPGEMIGLMRD